jgi:hypothetical protein
MDSDRDAYRRSDPRSSALGLRYINFTRQRAIDWQIVLDIRHRYFEGVVQALLDAETGLYIPTRKLIGIAYGIVYPAKVLESGRRRGSDLVCQRFKTGRASPVIHFDLLEPIPGPDGQALLFDGSEQLRLTRKGLAWEAYPQVVDFRWPAAPWIDMD